MYRAEFGNANRYSLSHGTPLSCLVLVRASSDSLMRRVKRTGTFLPLFPTIVILTKCLHSFGSSGVRAKRTSPRVSDSSIVRYNDGGILDTCPLLRRLSRTICVSITCASAFQLAGDECSLRSSKHCCCLSAR